MTMNRKIANHEIIVALQRANYRVTLTKFILLVILMTLFSTSCGLYNILGLMTVIITEPSTNLSVGHRITKQATNQV